MGEWNQYHPWCSKKCGRRTSHKTEICNECRKKKCVQCTKEFVWKKEETQVCSECRIKTSRARKQCRYDELGLGYKR